MENNLSIGTYSISSDGVSINYSAPSFLSKEQIEKINDENDENDENDVRKTINKGVSFDSLLSGILTVPKENY